MAAKKKPSTIDDLMKMAKNYSIDKNALFLSAINQYALQQQVITSIKQALDEDDVTVEKEYVKSRKNVYAHPAIKELPRHTDSANKTADLILKIILSLGKEPKAEGKLGAMMKE